MVWNREYGDKKEISRNEAPIIIQNHSALNFLHCSTKNILKNEKN